MLDPALTAVLSDKRDHLNQRFEQGRHQYPKLEAEAFRAFLSKTLVPLAETALRVAPDRLDLIVVAAYDVGLSLVGQGLAGPGARVTNIEAGLRRLGQACMGRVAEQPRRTLSALSNALHHLTFTQGASPEQWLDDMECVLPHVKDVEQLLAAGQVAAWRAGMAHYRAGALAQAAALPEVANRVLLHVPEDRSWAEAFAQLSKNRWYDPARASGEATPRWVGGFRGFGGLFAEPPKIAVSDEHVLVRSGDACWLLIADAFGATFHKATPGEVEQAGPFEVEERFSVQADQLFYDGRATGAAARGALTGAVCVAGTLAATFSHSHDVVLLSGEGA